MIARTARRVLLLAVAVLCVVSLRAQDTPTPPQVAAPPIELNAYVAELDRCAAAVSDLQSHPEKVAQLRASLPKSWNVATATGAIEVSTRPLDDLLRQWDEKKDNREATQKDIQSDLAAMRREAVELEKQADGPSDGGERAKLKEILNRREFRSVQGPSWWDEMKQKFWDWFGRMWDKLFGRLHISPSVGSAISWILIGAAFIVIVWLIARNLLAQSRGFGLHLQAPQRTHQSSREWVDAAVKAANGGDFREAIHCAYWAAVYRLDEAGLWGLDPTRTPREYLRLLQADVPQRTPMSEITRNFEIVWYGDQPASADDFRHAVSGLEKLGCHLPSAAAIENS